MGETAIIQYLIGTFAGIHVVVADGNSFFFYSPEGKMPERTFPFATLVTKDDYDGVSNLSRPDVFRLNIGVSRQTFHSLFGGPMTAEEAAGRYDFAALDRLMPHPVYGAMHWVCVLNPREATWAVVQPLLAEAYERAFKKHSATPGAAEAET